MRVNRRSHRGVATPPAHLACCRGHALARTQKRARTSTHGRACQAHARKVAAKKRTHEEKRMRTKGTENQDMDLSKLAKEAAKKTVREAEQTLRTKFSEQLTIMSAQHE